MPEEQLDRPYPAVEYAIAWCHDNGMDSNRNNDTTLKVTENVGPIKYKVTAE